ncbi:hypothetical protein OBBRIDRAFT_551710 [Obba rivulosa]|uniref:Uncharacterized protein n=1 Tax=Obba rivulosa TaxID=1052685 RepID=A0A8E2DK37_9APHY|nr:hypothetical protein OBBRIDRAFT_551710 [Obba rivulosa]
MDNGQFDNFSDTQSETTSNVGGGVGLSDPVHSAERRRMLDVINSLRNSVAGLDIDLPMIAVVGSQSAGKSSLIEAISGITLPRAGGTCTRCPIKCRLKHSEDQWQCTVSVQFLANGMPREEVFGNPISIKSEVEDRIRRAQRAILNPGVPDLYRYLNSAEDDTTQTDLSFSSNCISLEITGNDVVDLDFVDLPGLIASVGSGGNPGDIALVHDLVKSYIEKPSCIVLLTVACETDFQNQAAHLLAKMVDPDGRRIVGVLTKPDRIPAGEEESWLCFIRNEKEPLDHGWFSVKQPDSRALERGITRDEAHREEDEFFAHALGWSDLATRHRAQLGTSNLVARLSDVLVALIRRRLPELTQDVQRLLEQTREELGHLPTPPAVDPVVQLHLLLSNFSRDLSKQMEGTPYEGLIQSFKPAQDNFRKAIRATAPDFRPTENPHPRGTALRPGQLVRPVQAVDRTSRRGRPRGRSASHSALDTYIVSGEEDDDDIPPNDGRAIYVDEVMACAESAVTRELPVHHPFVVIRDFITAIVEHWKSPAELLLDFEYGRLLQYVQDIIEPHFGNYDEGGLKGKIEVIINQYILSCREKAMSQIMWLLAQEGEPFTLNLPNYSNYKEKFLVRYRRCRQDRQYDGLQSILKAYKPPDPARSLMASYERMIPTPSMVSAKSVASSLASRTPSPTRGSSADHAINQALSGLRLIHSSFRDLDATDFMKLLPVDEYEPALNIMATVQAYFHVARKRFTDLVPMALDHELILSLTRGGTLDAEILTKLGVTGLQGPNRCRELLREPQRIARHRGELLHMLEQLDVAMRKLGNLT